MIKNKQKTYILLVLVLCTGVIGLFSSGILKGQGLQQAIQGGTPQDHVVGPLEEVIEEQQAEAEAQDEVKEQLDTYPLGNERSTEKSQDIAMKDKKSEGSKFETEKQPIDGVEITTDKYIVKENDTLFTIAQRANVTTEQLKEVNQLNQDVIMVGQVLFISAIENAPSDSDNSSKDTTSRGYREEDLYWLSRIIHAEAQGEPYVGKVAVGNVVLNRVESGLFPNTIKGVVFDKQHGYTQFSPVLDGNIYNTPNSDSINAAKDALNGNRPVGDALYFLNMSKSTNFWIVQNRKYFMTIGDHDFYY